MILLFLSNKRMGNVKKTEKKEKYLKAWLFDFQESKITVRDGAQDEIGKIDSFHSF